MLDTFLGGGVAGSEGVGIEIEVLLEGHDVCTAGACDAADGGEFDVPGGAVTTEGDAEGAFVEAAAESASVPCSAARRIRDL